MATGHLVMVTEEDGWLTGVLPNGEKVKFSPGARDNLTSRVGRPNLVGAVVRGQLNSNTSSDFDELPWFCHKIETVAEEEEFEAEVKKARKSGAAVNPELAELHQAVEALITQMTREITPQDAALRLIEMGEDPRAENWQEMVTASMRTLAAEARVEATSNVTRALADPSIRTQIANFGNDVAETADDEEENDPRAANE